MPRSASPTTSHASPASPTTSIATRSTSHGSTRLPRPTRSFRASTTASSLELLEEAADDRQPPHARHGLADRARRRRQHARPGEDAVDGVGREPGGVADDGADAPWRRRRDRLRSEPEIVAGAIDVAPQAPHPIRLEAARPLVVTHRRAPRARTPSSAVRLTGVREIVARHTATLASVGTFR